jgi:lipopolysaccharide export system protein LptC
MVLLLLLAGLSWWMHDVSAPEKQITVTSLRHDPDFFMNNFVLTTMNAQGTPKHRLKALYMAHFPDSETTELTEPNMTVYREDLEHWFIKAKQGVLSAGTEHLMLDGDVFVHRPDNNEVQELNMHTEDLALDLKRDYARTVQPVKITRGDTENITAIGMEYYMKEGRLVLNKQVRFVYNATVN